MENEGSRHSDIPTLRRSDTPTPRHERFRRGTLRPSDPPALRAPGLAFGAPAGASARPVLGPFCALRVRQKIFHFQFETGFPRVAFIFLGIKSGATSFGRKKAC